jgi:hypothetical protein
MVIMPSTMVVEQISLQLLRRHQPQAGMVPAAAPGTITVRYSINNINNNNGRCSITCPTPLHSSSNSIHHHHHHHHRRRYNRQHHPALHQEHPQHQQQHQKVTRTLLPRTRQPMLVPCHFACHTTQTHPPPHPHRRRRQVIPTVASTSSGASASAPFVSKSTASAFKTRHTVDSIANVPIARTFPIRIFHRMVHHQQEQ